MFSLNSDCGEVICILRFALPYILNSLLHECDGWVDCILCILCRLIFEGAPLSGEVKNRKSNKKLLMGFPYKL